MADTMNQLRVLLWHVHGARTTSFVRGRHRYLIPVEQGGRPWGRGRDGRDLPSADEVPAGELRETEPDVVVLQCPEEIDPTERWLGRHPGTDIPAVYVEHNTPRAGAATTRHPPADRTDIPIVHVTHFNDLMWDNGRAPTRVVPHGVVDPGALYTGEVPHGVALINEPMRRGRITGTDLLPAFATAGPVDVYGIGADGFPLDESTTHPVREIGDFEQAVPHSEIARRRVYLHTARWTSLGPSLLEAMHLAWPCRCRSWRPPRPSARYHRKPVRALPISRCSPRSSANSSANPIWRSSPGRRDGSSRWNTMASAPSCAGGIPCSPRSPNERAHRIGRPNHEDRDGVGTCTGDRRLRVHRIAFV